MTDGISLRLAPQAPDEDGVKIYATPNIADDLKADLDEAGFETSWGLEHAFGVDDALIIVAAAGGLPGLAAVLNAVFHRNRHRSIIVKTGDVEVSLTGMSESKSMALVENQLERVREQQRLLNESWRRVSEETTEDGDSDQRPTGPSNHPS